jgi:DNA-binding NarL/FixJ family response regulator
MDDKAASNGADDAVGTFRVVVADDHPPTRWRVRAALEGRGFVVVGEAADADTTVRVVKRERPDVCLLDIRMPGGGILAAARITEAVPQTAIVMFTVSTADSDLLDALRAGATGYLLKGMDLDRLHLALRGVLEGEAALPRNLVARLVEEFRARTTRKRLPLRGRQGVDLTTREWEVLEFLRQGLTTAEIAARLFVSPVTVRSHVSAVLHKLHVPDRATAVHLLDQT